MPSWQQQACCFQDLMPYHVALRTFAQISAQVLMHHHALAQTFDHCLVNRDVLTHASSVRNPVHHIKKKIETLTIQTLWNDQRLNFFFMCCQDDSFAELAAAGVLLSGFDAISRCTSDFCTDFGSGFDASSRFGSDIRSLFGES